MNKYTYFLILFFIFWGSQHPALKVLTETFPPLTLNFLRFLSAFIVIAPFAIHKLRQTRVAFEDLLWLISSGLIGIALYGTLFMWGLTYTTAVEGSILLNTHPFFAILLAHFMISEKLNIRKTLALIFGFSGMFIALTNFSLSTFSMTEHSMGNLLILISAPCIAFFTVVTKKFSHYGASVCNFYSMLSGIIGLALVMPFMEPDFNYYRVSLNSWLLLLYAGPLLTGLAWIIWLQAMHKLGVGVVGNYIFIIPVSAIVFSHYLLDEPLYYSTAVGALLILFGIHLVNKASKS